jgi:hypothetical protein
MRQFKCHSCRRDSRFLIANRKLELFLEMKRSVVSTEETRTYNCEHCGVESRITQPQGAWLVIDAAAGR